MRKLQIFTTAAALLVVASAPSLAASRTHRAVDAYASGAVTTDRSGAYYYGPQDAQGRVLGEGVADRMYIAGALPNNPDNLIRWIRGPRDINPKTDMPNMSVTESDARDIAAYLLTLR